jgi:hypothetical protein
MSYKKPAHTATIKETVLKKNEPRKIIAYRGKLSGGIYFPSLYDLKEEVCISIEGTLLRVYTPGDFNNPAFYEPIYEGDAEFTITIK